MKYRAAHSRRTFMRGMLAGAAVHVGLPLLELGLNLHGDALADGGPLPTRFGVWFWGNGVRPEHWIPAQTGQGAAWQLSAELSPLAAHKHALSVLSGATLKTGTHPHHAGMTGVMTGAPLYQVGVTRDTIVSTFAEKSVDVIAADHYSGQTPFRSLEVGVTRFRGTDEGTTFQHLSHNGPNNPNPSEYSPRALFSRLFNTPTDLEVNLARMSVLDAVHQDITSIKGQVGARDRARLDQHFESIRALELRLASEPVVCATPTQPEEIRDIDGREQIAEVNALMSELVTLALACDLTRVFSIQFSTCGSGVIMWPAGATDGLHRTCHDEPLSGSPNTQPTVHAATVFTMEQLAVFLQGLSETPMGAGSLLDRCSILCTTEHTDGRTHSYDNFPLLIAGTGGGRLRGDVHYRASTQTSISRGVLTALRAGGVPAVNFGHEAGLTTEGINAFEIS